MKAFLMSGTQKEAFDKDLFAILESRYEGLDMQTARSNNEMASMLKSDTYDFAIVNSDKDALALSTAIIASSIAMPILVYTETNYIPFIKKLYGIGVSAVLNIAADDNELLKAVADVLAKRIYISESLKEALLQSTSIVDDYENIGYSQDPFRFNDAESSTMELTFLKKIIPFFAICLN